MNPNDYGSIQRKLDCLIYVMPLSETGTENSIRLNLLAAIYIKQLTIRKK